MSAEGGSPSSASGSYADLVRRLPLVGREPEFTRLIEAAETLSSGAGGRVISLVGEAGIGKSRLLYELRASLDDGEFRWLEGHARADRGNEPYVSLTDLLTRAWDIADTDPSATVAAKVERNAGRLLPDQPDAPAYLGRLFALGSPELASVDPEAWRTRVHAILRDLLHSLADIRPTIVVLEDFHWAVPSSLGLVRELIGQPDLPVLIICAYRPPFDLIGEGTSTGSGACHEQIILTDLCPDEAARMMASLLQTKEIPVRLAELVSDSARGNPLHLEELLSTLIESGAVARGDEGWEVTRPLSTFDVPLSLGDVLATRVDHLSEDARQVLREAAVIGRVFPYDVLREITVEKDHLDECLADLESLDLVRAGRATPGAEYRFKHDLTRQAAYEDLPSDEKPALHERLATVLETTYRERLAEASDSLAFHFARGLSLDKAVRYLMMSGAKSVEKYALDEAHRYFEQAYELVSSMPESERTPETDALLVDILGAWGLVFPFRGEFEALRDTLGPHRATIERHGHPERMAAYYVALSAAEWGCGCPAASDELALRTLELAEAAGNVPLEGIALNSHAWAMLEMGELEEAVGIGWRGHQLTKDLPGDPIAQWASLHAVGIAHWYQGAVEAGERAGIHLAEYSRGRGNPRGLFASAFCRSHSCHSAGDFDGAVRHLEEACELPSDPVHVWGARVWGGAALAESGRYEDAERILLAVVVETTGRSGFMARLAQIYLALCLAARGQFREADESLRDAMRFFDETKSVCRSHLSEYLLGKVYAGLTRLASGDGPGAIREAAVPRIRDLAAADRAGTDCLSRAIEGAETIGACGIACPAYLELARLHESMGRDDLARECSMTALKDAERRGATGYADRAREAVAGLGA